MISIFLNMLKHNFLLTGHVVNKEQACVSALYLVETHVHPI